MASAPFSFLLISAPSWAHQWTQTTAAIFSWTCWPAGGSVGATHFQQVWFRVTYGLYTTDCRLARVAPTTAIGGQQLANLFKRGTRNRFLRLFQFRVSRGHLLLRVKEKTETKSWCIGDVIMYMSVDWLAVVAPLLPSCLERRERHQVTFLRFNMF
jgi:hypothetical protein